MFTTIIIIYCLYRLVNFFINRSLVRSAFTCGPDIEYIKSVLNLMPSKINRQTLQWVTLLMIAAYKNNTVLMYYLLQNGANPFLRDCQGFSAEDYARNEGNIQALELLSQYELWHKHFRGYK